ncbi:HIT domain-containing protein [Ketobacter sp.]|uniref:HIT domain-containing protein n=1 Tax=Ketobacter sp. TaxID=2083498 RepID=UPI000F17526D|nr:HIT family protein [Ketobacter sp.]RLT92503.1 MAG: HIT family protein [Ketobacter sp.]
MAFELHPQLAADTILVREESDLLLLMMDDAQYPWFIVVPKQVQITEWHDLDQAMQIRLHLYCVELGKAVTAAFGSTKINTAALGNMVSQLHVHVIGRRQQDPAWPKPVWGQAPRIPMEQEEIKTRTHSLNQYFSGR